MTKPSCLIGKKMPDNTGLYHKMGLPLLLMALLLAGLSTSTQAESGGSITPRIVGGINANPGDYPWAVALLRTNISDGFDAQFCGGTLIASRWVLTAAHCVENLSSASEIEVAIGINNLDNINNADRQTVSNIFIHPDYNTNSLNNDIALLELATPSNNTVLAIADNNFTDNIATAELMTIIGWGSVKATTPFTFPTLLQETQIPRFDFAACNTVYSNLLTDNMICAGFADGGKDTCQGDSGGPILYFNTSDSTYYQTGVTSFGDGCAAANKPGVYARTANYLDWINATTSVITLAKQHQFGYHGVGHSTSTTLTLYNYSGENITVSAVNLDNPTNFTLPSQNCIGTIIANNDSCSITLQFQATNAGTHLATLSVDFGTGNPSINSAISGTGLATVNNATGLDETPARLWYSGDNASWFNAPTNNSTGGTAMRSGNIGDNQNTALLAYFTGPDTLSFRWKASTEQDFDLLKLYINDVLIDAISGNQDWQQRNIALSAGEHRIVWVYEKDSTISHFQDTVWLDSINTPFVSTPGTNPPPGGLGSGGGKLSGLFLLLLIVMLILRKNLYRRQTIPSDNKPHMAGA